MPKLTRISTDSIHLLCLEPYFKVASFAVVGIILGLMVGQGVASSFRLYPSVLPGLYVHPFDSTVIWAAARVLFLNGTSPYSSEGDSAVETANFGRPLEPGDERYVHDQQHFSYPLHIAILYFPTVALNLPPALVVLAFSFYASLLTGITFWFRLLRFPRGPTVRALVLAGALALPATYTVFQTRQPAAWVFLFLSAGIYLTTCRQPRTDILAGFLLAWSTIKPQSSVIVLIYMVLLYYLARRGLKASLPFLTGLGGAGLLLMALDEWLLPGWLPQFLSDISRYQDYAGLSGAEMAFGRASGYPFPAMLSLAAIFGGMCLLMLRHLDWEYGHLLTLATALAVQIWIFPTHPYNYIFCIPLLLVAFKVVSRAHVGSFRRHLLLASLFLISLYLAFSGWVGILSADSSGLVAAFAVGDIIASLEEAFGGVSAFFPLVGVLLGAALFFFALPRSGRQVRTSQLAVPD